MADLTEDPKPEGCKESCSSAPSIEALNRTCYCLTLDEAALRRTLEADLGVRGLFHGMAETHPHLFASLPVFVARGHLEQMARVIEAVERVVEAPLFRRAALAWAPEIAGFDPGLRGGLLGYDFHVTGAGPQLIEINTNPGGALLNALLGRAQRACCADADGLMTAPVNSEDAEQALVEMFLAEWRLQRGAIQLRSVAIVDEVPDQQYLYPEFLLYQQLLKRHNIETVICDPRDLITDEGRVRHRELTIDFVYNRLTDFSLQLPAHATLKAAYMAGEVVVSPNPRAHALYSDKRNLTLLCDAAFLRSTGVADDVIATLVAGIPRTEVMTAENREAMWTNRRQLFFKPAAGYGSRATYRGDKVTKRVWEDIAAGTYVAQALVAPSKRHLAGAKDPNGLKVDVRNYAYAGVVKLVAARLYQGQTTNFRTPGGGFAPVLTSVSATPASTYGN
ncbi:MAG: hypothetical protein ABL989_11775 [Gammaproteobacteria bacterium]